MKKTVFTIILCSMALLTHAQTTVTITAGGLENALSSQTFPITHLVVNGTMDVRDFAIIQDWAKSSLVTLDLSGVTKIEEYTGWGTNDNKTYPANEFPEKALYQVNGALTTVILPTNAGITSIGLQAFRDCTKLTSVNIPDGLVNIGDFAFYRTGITSITIPEGVTTIGAGVFSWATALTSVTLPSSLTSLGSSVFAYANHLTQVIFPASVNLTSIPNNAFEATLISSIIIPETVTIIGNYAFRSCKLLQEIHLPEGLQWLGGTQTFQGCTTLTTINIPEGVQIIDGILNGTFYNASVNITSFKVPANVTEITGYAFGNKLYSLTFAENSNLKKVGKNGLCGTKLTSLVIPEGVTEIGESALADNNMLQTLELPTSLENIGKAAFQQSSGLKSIIVHNDWPVVLPANTSWVYDPDLDDVVEVSRILVFDGIDKATCILYVPTADALEAFKEADGWKEFGDNIRIIVAKQSQTIENFTDITKAINDADFDLTATATSGLAVTYSSSNENVATISGNTVHIVGAGTTTITASQAGDDTYNAATDVTATLTVSKASQTITGLSDMNKKVGDADFTLSATASSNLAVTYSSSNENVATISGNTVHIVGAGTTTITVSQAGNDTYSAATDVTATLTVTPIDGLNDVRTQLPVRIQNGNIIVTATSGSTVEVFNAIGLKLQSQTTNSTETTLSNLPQGQVLIVRSGNAVAKVIL